MYGWYIEAIKTKHVLKSTKPDDSGEVFHALMEEKKTLSQR